MTPRYPPTVFNTDQLRGFTELAKLGIPSGMKHSAIILSLLCFGIIMFLIYVPWVQTAYGTGILTTLNPGNRVQHINAFVDGRIKQWYVSDGSMVAKGDKIVEIADIDERLIERLEAERDALAQDHELTVLAAQTAKLNMDRKQNLIKQGLAADREFEEAKIKYKTLLSKQSQAYAKLQQIEVKLSRQDTQVIRAPRDGTILSIISGNTGTTVKQGDRIVSFVPTDVTVAVELFIDSMDVPLVQPGRKVRLQFEGWPVIQFSGWPTSAVGTFGGVVQVVNPSVSDNGKFRVIVMPDPDDPHPWPDPDYLRLGAKVKGWILLETVSVGYELWRQLNNFPPEFETGYIIKEDKTL